MKRPLSVPVSPNYRQVLRGYLRLHQLTVEGRDESPDADAVRDSLDLPWRALGRAERERVQGLSADLFNISEPISDSPQEMPPHAQKALAEAFEAKQRGEWDRTLDLLRRWGKFIAPALLSYLRGGVWSEAGYPEVGAVFYEHASNLEPENANYAMLFLHTLEKYDPRIARERASRILQNPEKYSPLLVVKAGNVAFNATREMTESDAAAVYHQLIPVLSGALSEVSEDDKRSIHLLGIVLLAQSHDRLGEVGASLEYYSRGLKIDPSHDALLTGRGILTYGKSAQSPSDLEQAAELGTPLVWPYFFLAHHYLVNNRCEDCRRMCEIALRMNASRAVRSQLSEWSAIAEAELGFPADRVRAAFENALRLDPSNETARQNLDRFEHAIARVPSSKGWEKRTANTVRVFGQAEYRDLTAA